MNELWLKIQAFFEILATRNVLIEIAATALCLLVGGLVGLELSRRFRSRRLKTPMALTYQYFATQGAVVVLPVAMVNILATALYFAYKQ